MRVTFEPGAVQVEATAGERLLDAARRAGAGIVADCGGRGKCGSCLVLLETATASALSPLSSDEDKLLPLAPEGKAFRLACMARVQDDVTVEIPPESRSLTSPPRKPFTRHRIRIRPAVSRLELELPPAGPGAETVGERVASALSSQRKGRVRAPSLAVQADFSRQTDAERAEAVTATLFQGRDVVRLRPGRRTGLYGVAVDVGTTSVVCFLCDLIADKIIAVRSAVNPQAAYGEDVISRIAAVQRDPAKLTELQRLVVREINSLIEESCREVGIEPHDVVDAVAVGNPTMQHLLLALSPLSLGRAPYLPFTRAGGEVEAGSLGLCIHPHARVHLLPLLSGFIGADTLSALLALGPGFFRGTNLLVDVGTNGEIVLADRGNLTATSCATGPVFEGAHIRSGMRAAPGAVEWVRAGPSGELELGVIAGEGSRAGRRPAGLCGSGVISAVAALAEAGVLRRDGAFELEAGLRHSAVREDGKTGMAEMVLAPAGRSHTGRDVVLTQADVRAVQLGKAALRAGVEILLREQGVERLDRIYLAGTFGNYLEPFDVLRIGMLPPVGLENIASIGNAAGDGARLALFSTVYRRRALKLAERIRVVELSLRPDFQEVFVGAMELAPELDL